MLTLQSSTREYGGTRSIAVYDSSMFLSLGIGRIRTVYIKDCVFKRHAPHLLYMLIADAAISYPPRNPSSTTATKGYRYQNNKGES